MKRTQIMVFIIALLSSAMMIAMCILGCAGSKALTPEQQQALQDSLFNEHKQQLRLWNSFAFEPFKQGDYAQAKVYYKRIAEADTSGIYAKTVFRNLGTCYIQLGQPDSAEWAYRLGIERNPQDPYSHKLLAYIYRIQGRVDEAIQEYELLTQLEPDSTGHFKYLGEQYVRAGNVDQAIPAYQRAVELNPSDKSAQQVLNNLWTQTNNTDAILAQRESMVEKFPEDMRFRLDLARTYFDIGRFENAIIQLNIIIQKEPENIQALEMLGESYQQMEKYEEAITTYQKILNFKADDKKNICNLATAYAYAHKYTIARVQVQRALRIDPNYGLAHLTYGLIFERCADACVDAAEGKIDFNDKLVYKMAYDEYQRAKQDMEWRSEAEKRLVYLETQIPTRGDYFMHKNQTVPEKPCYDWIQ